MPFSWSPPLWRPSSLITPLHYNDLSFCWFAGFSRLITVHFIKPEVNLPWGVAFSMPCQISFCASSDLTRIVLPCVHILYVAFGEPILLHDTIFFIPFPIWCKAQNLMQIEPILNNLEVHKFLVIFSITCLPGHNHSHTQTYILIFFFLSQPDPAHMLCYTSSMRGMMHQTRV